MAAFGTAVSSRGLLPADGVHEAGAGPVPGGWGALGALARTPLFALVILSAGLIQASNAFYSGFSAILWREAGLGPEVVGLLWGVGVACEVAFLTTFEPLRRRLGPERLLVLAGLAAVVRWCLMALSPPGWAIWLIQPLHALTLSAPFVASIQIVARIGPAGSASAAQQLNAALASGLLMGVATVWGGWLHQVGGAFGYLAMALMALAGLAGSIAVMRSVHTPSSVKPG